MLTRSRMVGLSRPLHIAQTLGPMQRGCRDPTMRIRGSEMLRATGTPAGPASFWLSCRPQGTELVARAWGPGAEWVLESLPDLVGEPDDARPLMCMVRNSTAPERALLLDLIRHNPGLRIPRSGAVTECLVPTILEQKVTGAEARRSYRDLVRRFGGPAPGPSDTVKGLMVAPGPDVLRTTPYWEFHRIGVELKRARTVRAAAELSTRLERLVDLPPAEARLALTTIPGVGEWTAAEVALLAFGDCDAVSVGDYHIPHQITWSFTGRHRGDDETMLRLLEPYRGQRGRVIRLVQAAGVVPPRRGPRLPVRDFRQS